MSILKGPGSGCSNQVLEVGTRAVSKDHLLLCGCTPTPKGLEEKGVK